MKNYPKRGSVYSLREICNNSRDNAILMFWLVIDGKHVECGLEDSHLTDEELLSIPGFADSKWSYLQDPDAWIPRFIYVGNEPITDFIEFQPSTDPSELTENPDSQWCCPKGFFREQY